jgi:hypothetical protein
MLAAAAEFVWKYSLGFSAAWAVLYLTVGTWAKVRYGTPKHKSDAAGSRRYGPIVVSHALFTIAFANPFCLFVLIWKAGDTVSDMVPFMDLSRISSTLAKSNQIIESASIATFQLMFMGVYFVLLSWLTDLLVLHVAARVRWLRWLGCRTNSARWLLTHIATTLLLLLVVCAVCWGLACLWI